LLDRLATDLPCLEDEAVRAVGVPDLPVPDAVEPDKHMQRLGAQRYVQLHPERVCFRGHNLLDLSVPLRPETAGQLSGDINAEVRVHGRVELVRPVLNFEREREVGARSDSVLDLLMADVTPRADLSKTVRHVAKGAPERATTYEVRVDHELDFALRW
jgi:hypothetical protein